MKTKVLHALLAVFISLPALGAEESPEERVNKALANVSVRLENTIRKLEAEHGTATQFNKYLDDIHSIESTLKRTKDPAQNVKNRAKAMEIIESFPSALQYDFKKELELIAKMDEPAAQIARELLLDLGNETPAKESSMPERAAKPRDAEGLKKRWTSFESIRDSLVPTRQALASCLAEVTIRAARVPLDTELKNVEADIAAIPDRVKAKEAELKAFQKMHEQELRDFQVALGELAEIAFEYPEEGIGQDLKQQDEDGTFLYEWSNNLFIATWSDASDIYRFDRSDKPHVLAFDRVEKFLTKLPTEGLEKKFVEAFDYGPVTDMLTSRRENGKLTQFKINEEARKKVLKMIPEMRKLAISEGRQIAEKSAIRDAKELKAEHARVQHELNQLDSEINSVCRLRTDSFQAIEAAAKEGDDAKAGETVANQAKPLSEVRQRYERIKPAAKPGTHLP